MGPQGTGGGLGSSLVVSSLVLWEHSYFCLPSGAAEGMGFFGGCFALISSDAGAVNCMTQGGLKEKCKENRRVLVPTCCPSRFLKMFLWALLGMRSGERWVLGLSA